jgi:hypothetical protein
VLKNPFYGKVLRGPHKNWLVQVGLRLPDWNYPALFLAGILVAIAASGALLPPRSFTGSCGNQANGAPAQCSAQIKRPESSDERTANYTEALAWFTAALVVVAALEIFYLSKAATISAQQKDFMGVQNDIARAQQGLANAQYFSTHRPRVVIKNVFFADGSDRLVLSIDIANTGGTKATIVGSWFCLASVIGEQGFRRQDVGGLRGIDGMLFGESQIQNIMRQTPEKVAEYISRAGFEGLFPDDPSDPRGKLYFFGAIRYVDERGEELGITRLSVFRRRWDGLSASFKRTGNRDHEYAD